MHNPEQRMTPRQAYLAMFEFLRQHHERGPTDEIGGLLGSLSLLPDGGPADSALADDWAEAVAAVLEAEVSGGYTAAAMHLG